MSSIENDCTFNAKFKGYIPGDDGATFTPTVSEQGYISWENDKGLPNPEPVNITGPQGIPGPPGPSADPDAVLVPVPYFTERDLSGSVELAGTLWHSAAVTPIIQRGDDSLGHHITSVGTVASTGTEVKFTLYTANITGETCTLTKLVDLGTATADGDAVTATLSKAVLDLSADGGHSVGVDRFVIFAHAKSAAIGCAVYGQTGLHQPNFPYIDPDVSHYNADSITCPITSNANEFTYYGAVPIIGMYETVQMMLSAYVYDHEMRHKYEDENDSVSVGAIEEALGYKPLSPTEAAGMLGQVLTKPIDSSGKPLPGTAGQFAVSDGKGGITWLTIGIAEEEAY